MSPVPATSPAATLASPAVPARLVLLLATGAGLAVASLYYSQPMLGVMAPDLHASDATAGAVPTLTQLGYALGILLLAPLGDRYDQDIVPAAAALAPATQRGKVVGTVMTGLLLGILLSRVVSGFVAAHFGWRAMFVLAAASIAAVALVARRQLPRFAPATTWPYRALLASLAALWRQHGALRRAALAQALLSVGFSAFWSTLAVMLHGAPFHLGSEAAGAFGL
ncbi:MAG: MFS transporter, partial [Cupriavidus sp.]|nr:MFS transporter [Cupriavidus sp.]